MMPSPEIDVCLCFKVFAGAKRKEHVGDFLFHLSPRVHASTHEPGNTRYLFNEHTHRDVTDLQCSQTLGALVAVAPFPPSSTHTKRSHERTQTLVYRDLISRHPGRYVSDHKQAGGEGEVDVDHKAVCFWNMDLNRS